MARTVESTRGGGRKASLGRLRCTSKRQVRSQRPAPGARPSAYLRATWRCKTMSADRMRDLDPRRVCSNALETP